MMEGVVELVIINITTTPKSPNRLLQLEVIIDHIGSQVAVRIGRCLFSAHLFGRRRRTVAAVRGGLDVLRWLLLLLYHDDDDRIWGSGA